MPEFSRLSAEEIAAGDALIAGYEPLYRRNMPGEAPRFDPSAARWAGVSFFRACQFTVFRDLSEKAVNQELGAPLGQARSAEVHYSVDLIFRYLPDLWNFAHSASEHDPLLEHLSRWARAWPLSSVGMSGVAKVSIDEFADSPSLLQLYVDRVVDRGDESRLTDVRVRQAARAALGMFPDLHPRLSRLLVEETS